MAYLIETIVDRAKMDETCSRHAPRLVGQVEQADRLEVWGSGFSDPGPDWCELRLMNDGVVVAKSREAGY